MVSHRIIEKRPPTEAALLIEFFTSAPVARGRRPGRLQPGLSALIRRKLAGAEKLAKCGRPCERLVQIGDMIAWKHRHRPP